MFGLSHVRFWPLGNVRRVLSRRLLIYKKQPSNVRLRCDGKCPMEDLVVSPGRAATVLLPLEVAADDAATVGENVRHDADTPVLEDQVGHGRDRTVGALDHESGADLVRVAGGDHAADCSWNQHVDV